MIGVRLIALAAALGSAGAAQAEVLEVGAGGTVKVLSDAPNATWASTDQTDQVEAIEGGADVPATAVTVLTEQGWSGAYAEALVEVAQSERHQPLFARSRGLAGEPLEPVRRDPAQVPSVWRN